MPDPVGTGVGGAGAGAITGAAHRCDQTVTSRSNRTAHVRFPIRALTSRSETAQAQAPAAEAHGAPAAKPCVRVSRAGPRAEAPAAEPPGGAPQRGPKQGRQEQRAGVAQGQWRAEP